jgi:hypothetical protein
MNHWKEVYSACQALDLGLWEADQRGQLKAGFLPRELPICQSGKKDRDWPFDVVGVFFTFQTRLTQTCHLKQYKSIICGWITRLQFEILLLCYYIIVCSV